jgi:hypothetical protein
MANKKITELTELTTPAGADIVAIVDDVAGTPTTKKVTATNLMTLAPVQSVAGQTGTVTLSNTDISGLGTAATADTGTSANNVVQLDGTAKLPAVDGSQLTGISTDVEGTAVLSTGETGGVKFLREDGDGTCSWQTATADVATPLNEALRGTANPHIGAFPNQPFNALDNPDKSVMVVTNSAGELDFLIPDGGNIFINSPTGGRLSPSFGFSVVEDANEPDIEVASGGENYSVISGDSDSLAVNGLPIRQGFNNPDIGANASPLLISGGSIA